MSDSSEESVPTYVLSYHDNATRNVTVLIPTKTGWTSRSTMGLNYEYASYETIEEISDWIELEERRTFYSTDCDEVTRLLSDGSFPVELMGDPMASAAQRAQRTLAHLSRE